MSAGIPTRPPYRPFVRPYHDAPNGKRVPSAEPKGKAT